jgi:hypothetical protein
MSKKKSYMNRSNIIEEGLFKVLFDTLFTKPTLKKNKPFQKALKDLNKSIDKLEKSMNKSAEMKGEKKVKLDRYNLKDFV